jgi:hypothetical protein
MKKQSFYSSPTIEVAELFVEKGIAQSSGGIVNDYGDEGAAGGGGGESGSTDW